MNRPKSNRIVQTGEILSEYDKKIPDIYKITKLFKEIFEDMTIEEKNGYEVDLKLTCIEADNLCTYLQSDDRFKILPYALQEVIKECTTLHDYPSKYSLSSPKELLNNTIKIFNKHINIENHVVTLKDKIINLYKEGKDENNITNIINVDKNMVHRTILIAKKQLMIR